MGRTGTQAPEVTFGRRLRQWRQSRRQSLREASAGAGFSIAYLSDLETGKRGISLGNAVKIAAYTGRRLDWFLKEDAS